MSLGMLGLAGAVAEGGLDGREAGELGELVCAKAGIVMSAATATLARSLVLLIRYLLLVGERVGERRPRRAVPAARPQSVAHLWIGAE
jgi:hypothetical protein